MQVLGALIHLPGNGHIPIPWWQRAPLGLQSQTWCYVALISSARRPVPDLIVSVLDPSNWSKTKRIRCQHIDEPGVISKAVSAVHDLNIALAESATLDAGAIHEVTLYCEPTGSTHPLPDNDTLYKRFTELNFYNVTIEQFTPLPVVWQKRCLVDGGWIRNEEWRLRLRELVTDPRGTDLNSAVVSADTANRFVRFVFPRHNAKTFYVEHLDEAGVLRQITDILFANHFNILSQLLRRGGATPGHAMLVAACEPEAGIDVDKALEATRKQLHAVSPRLMIQFRMHSGLRAHNTINARERGTIVARVPSGLKDRVARLHDTIPTGKTAVFFSHRFVDHSRAQSIAEAVRKALAAADLHLLEASPDDDILGPELIYNEVSAKMWAAHSGIVLMVDIGQDDPTGKNLPHELGFMLGQGKPLLMLVDSRLNKSPMGTNLDGVYAPRFPGDEIAFDDRHPNSIAGIIRKWAARIKE